jgi:ATP-dependent DNA ligase
LVAGLHADLREGARLEALHPILCRMRKFCVWLKPEAVAQIEVLEWIGADHPRHTKFVTLRDVKDAQKVVRDLAVVPTVS